MANISASPGPILINFLCKNIYNKWSSDNHLEPLDGNLGPLDGKFGPLDSYLGHPGSIYENLGCSVGKETKPQTERYQERLRKT